MLFQLFGSWLLVVQGLPGAYSEAAAAKAYPDCEAVPCELFETAFDVSLCCSYFLPGISLYFLSLK